MARRTIATSEVNDSVQNILHMHALGQTQLRAENGRLTQKDNAANQEFNQLDRTKQNQILNLANPETGYSDGELKALLRFCDNNEYKLTLSVIWRLLSIPKHDRTKVHKSMIEQKMSKRDLDEYISANYGKRRSAGRKPRMPKSPEAALALIRALCISWERMSKVIRESGHLESGKAADADIKKYWKVTEVLKKYRRELDNELSRFRKNQ